MNKTKLKPVLIGLLMLWLLFFAMDSIVGIAWPSHTIQQVFVWTPTVLIAVYWLVFGGEKSDKS